MCLHPETNVSLCLASPALLLPPVPARSPPVERLPVQLFDTEPDVHSRIIYPGVGVQLGVENVTILPAVFG